MEITIKKTVEEKQNLTLPLFKEKIRSEHTSYSEYIAIYSEEKAFKLTVFDDGGTAHLSKQNADTLYKLSVWLEGSRDIPEEEFLTAWNNALQSLSELPVTI